MSPCLKSGEKLTQLNLVIPGLCGPLPDLDRLDSEAVQSLVNLLAKSDKKISSCKSFYEELANLFSLDQNQSFPAAALSLLGNNKYNEGGHWFLADPIHLQADVDHAILRDSHGLDLSIEESEALVEELNSHFMEDGICFLINNKDSWFVNVPAHHNIATTPVHDVISRNVYTFMPQGDDALFWKKIMNEVQMLMYQSQVNEQRETQGKLPINGVWFWGEGELPAKTDLATMEVYSQSSMVKGLAILNEFNYRDTSDIDAFLKQVSPQSNNLLVLDDLFNLTCYGDVMAWQSSFDILYKDWLRPIFSWAEKEKVMINLMPCNGTRYQIPSKHRFRFFRDKRIASYITTYE